MPDQDAPVGRVEEMAHAINTQIGELWLQAHADGMRNGMEVAATLCNDTANALADEPGDHAAAVKALQTVRDEIRLLALQVDDPDQPGVSDG